MKMRACVVLVVGDTPGVTTLVGHLVRMGHTVARAPTADEGLTTLAQRAVDLAISCLVMPGTDGLEFLAAARDAHPRVPVILLADRPEATDVVEAFRGQAADVLLEPVSRLDLSRSLTRALTVRGDDVPADDEPPAATAPPPEPAGEPASAAEPAETSPEIDAGPDDSDLTPEMRRDRVRLLDRLRRVKVRLPLPPGTLTSLGRLSQVAEPDPEAVFALLESDPLLSMTVFKLAQSPRFRGSAPPTSTRDAAVRVGALRALSAALSVSHRSAYDFEDAHLRRYASALWLTHFLTSLVADEVWTLQGFQGRHQIQSMGLMMSTGEIMALRAAVDLWPTRIKPDGRPEPNLEKIIGSVQAEVGAQTLIEWGMPATHIFAARHHAARGPIEAETPLALRLTCLRLARYLVMKSMPRTTLGGAPPYGREERALALRAGEDELAAAVQMATDRARDVLATHD